MDDIILKILSVLCCIFHSGSGQYIQDSRCFLENGLTAAHLFVKEDLKVGDTIGLISVIGDPGPEGDIVLRLQEHDSPITFSSHSRNLTLTRSLDKEGIDGPASVYINVICERKHTLDPVFVIPINIRVTDANDNVPEFINAPYVLNISEVTVVGTRVLQGVKAVDADQPGPYSTVQYSILSGPYGDFFVFANALEGTLVLQKPLDYEALRNFSVQIRAQDQGSPSQLSITTLYVNIIDADDQNPIFQNNQYKINVPLHQGINKVLQVYPAPIKAIDQDIGIRAPVKYSIQGGILPFLTLNTETADIILIRSLQNHELISSATLVIKAEQTDNSDRYALATVIICREDVTEDYSISGTRSPIRFVLKNYYTSVFENTPAGSVILRTDVNKITRNLRFWLIGASEDLNTFSMTNSGELILKGNLDYERRIHHTFLVCVTDNHYNDTAKVNISVEDINEWEPRFRHPRYEFFIKVFKEGSVVGIVEVADGDRGDRVSLTLRGPDARSFEIRDNGELILRSVGALNGTIARLVVIASDTGSPVRSSMIPVIVHLPNAAAVPVAARSAPAWLGNSVLLVGTFGALLGLFGVVILILFLYIYKHKKPNRGSAISTGTDNKEKSSIRSTLNSAPQIIDTSILQNALELSRDNHFESNDIDNPVFGEDNDCYNNTVKNLICIRHAPIYSKQKVAPVPEPPALSATSTIPNVGGLVQNMNDLSSRKNVNNMETVSQNSSNYSYDTRDSFAPTWPTESISKRIKKLSWNDDNKITDTEEKLTDLRDNDQLKQENLNLTVYF